MNQWTMVTMTYDRILGSLTYTGNIKVVLVTREAEELLLEQVEFEDMELTVFIRCLHQILRKGEGQIKVTIVRPIKASWSERPGRAMELSKEEVEIIKSDLPRALQMFAPITVTRNNKESSDDAEH